jgi:predicted alpha/beta hydrolase family esterase
MPRIVIVPGLGDSGTDHWQTIWAKSLGRGAVRIAPASFDEPDALDWLAALDRLALPGDVLIAHSLGCLAVATWLAHGARASGALFVAPPDPVGPAFPSVGSSFTAPVTALGTPALVVASEDDPYGDAISQRNLADAWGAGFVGVGRLGHLNAASGLGDWPEGRRLVTAFTAGLGDAVEVVPGPAPEERRWSSVRKGG